MECQQAQLITVIKTVHLRIGTGDFTQQNPPRLVERYWSLEGKLLFENDPVKNLPKDSKGIHFSQGRMTTDPLRED